MKWEEEFDEKFVHKYGDEQELATDIPFGIKDFITQTLHRAKEEDGEKYHQAVMKFGREVMRLAFEASKADGTHDHFAAKVKYSDVLLKEDILYDALSLIRSTKEK